jgi:hypothetical protein
MPIEPCAVKPTPPLTAIYSMCEDGLEQWGRLSGCRIPRMPLCSQGRSSCLARSGDSLAPVHCQQLVAYQYRNIIILLLLLLNGTGLRRGLLSYEIVLSGTWM